MSGQETAAERLQHDVDILTEHNAELIKELEALKDDHTELKEANMRLQDELEELRLVHSQCKDLGEFQGDIVNRDKVIAELRAELEDYKQTIGAIHVLVDLHTHKHPAPPQKTAEEFYDQFGPLVGAADEARNWFVDNWPKVINLVSMAIDAGLEEDLKKRGITIVDPGGKLIELDKALNVARGHTVQVRADV